VYLSRIFIITGITLIAIALAASGHGLWWLIGLVWAVGAQRHGWSSCYLGRGRRPTRQETTGAPDPTHDRHEAFPSAR